MTCYIWTDGSCNNHTHNNGGYGVVIKQGDQQTEIIGGQYVNTTNSRMELLAVLRALEHVQHLKVHQLKVYSDSEYVVNSINKGWARNWEKEGWKGNRLNRDLWEKLLHLLSHMKSPVQFNWVRGHAECEENERADRLAAEGAHYKTIIDDKQERRTTCTSS